MIGWRACCAWGKNYWSARWAEDRFRNRTKKFLSSKKSGGQ